MVDFNSMKTIAVDVDYARRAIDRLAGMQLTTETRLEILKIAGQLQGSLWALLSMAKENNG